MNGLIVAGGMVDAEQLKDIWIKLDHPFVIGADRGNVYLMENNIPIDLAVGDFDSINENEKLIIERFFKVEKLNEEKDDTDTEHAVRIMVEKEISKLYLMGCTGTRLDHTMSAVRLLKIAFDKGIDAFLVDAHNRIRVAKGTTILTKKDAFGKYVSVLPYGDKAASITEHGFKYELTDSVMYAESSLGISNELVKDVGMIVSDDYYIVMETND